VTVKDKVGRPRYIALQVTQGAPLSRPALSGALPPTARLTRFDGTYGIIKTGHRDRDAIVALLQGLRQLGPKEIQVETLVTSGTIRGAARALPPGSPVSRRTPPSRA
jgi:RNase P/RNase MRP subunit POP5